MGKDKDKKKSKDKKRKRDKDEDAARKRAKAEKLVRLSASCCCRHLPAVIMCQRMQAPAPCKRLLVDQKSGVGTKTRKAADLLCCSSGHRRMRTLPAVPLGAACLHIASGGTNLGMCLLDAQAQKITDHRKKEMMTGDAPAAPFVWTKKIEKDIVEGASVRNFSKRAERAKHEDRLVRRLPDVGAKEPQLRFKRDAWHAHDAISSRHLSRAFLPRRLSYFWSLRLVTNNDNHVSCRISGEADILPHTSAASFLSKLRTILRT